MKKQYIQPEIVTETLAFEARLMESLTGGGTLGGYQGQSRSVGGGGGPKRTPVF